MTTVTPVRAREQRLAALARANEVRVARSRLKQAIRGGDRDLALLLVRDPTPVVETMPVDELLLAIPRMGRRVLPPILRHARVSPCKTLGGLTHRQRRALLDELERP